MTAGHGGRDLAVGAEIAGPVRVMTDEREDEKEVKLIMSDVKVEVTTRK